MPKKRLFIAGPTGVGKTALSLRLAKAFHGEILSMDSMQIYRGMDIGTAKATPQEQAQVPHHLLDIVTPGVRYTVYDYQRDAQNVAAKLITHGILPIFTGGTGLYLNALLKGYQFTGVDTTETLRSQLEAESALDEGHSLYAELLKSDPATAQKITEKDKPRLVRAIEIARQTNAKPSLLRSDEADTSWENLVIVLSLPREALYDRINRRVLSMMEQGLIQEVKALLKAGVPFDSQAMRAIGYREIYWYFKGWTSYDETVSLIQRASRNYAKRQYTWYRKVEEAVWIEEEDPEERYRKAVEQVSQFLTNE